MDPIYTDYSYSIRPQPAIRTSCPYTWRSFNGRCYNLFTATARSSGVTWYAAQASCLSQGARLANINSAAELTYVKSFVKANGTSFVWVNKYIFTDSNYITIFC